MPTILEDHKATFTVDGAAILAPQIGTIFTLNATGSFIWSLLRQGETPDVIASQLAQESGQPFELVEVDVRTFIESLREQALVHDERVRP